MAGWLQLGFLFALLAVIYRPLGDYIAWVYTSPRSWRLERVIYRLTGIDSDREQRWPGYAASLLAFSAVSVLALYGLQRLQHLLPLSLDRPGVEPALAFNTAASFTTNTNWQAYAGESTMGHLVQMSGLAVQNFVSAAVGLGVAIALVRGFRRSESGTLGNFWVDLVRGCLRLLLPISMVAALFFVSQGVIQNLHGSETVATLEGGTQVIPGGPVASQEAIKELGTNGGGFFNANAAHPFENPNPTTNLVQLFLILAIPFSVTGAFGKMVGNRRQGYLIAVVMLLLLVGSALSVWYLEDSHEVLPGVVGGNMEGKEVRFGVAGSALYAATATGTSTGSVNSSLDSFSPLGGAVPLVNLMLSEVSPGGVGSGLYGMLVLAVLTVFMAGLMVGRTPEYLGKKIEPRDMKMAALYVLVTPATVLALTAVALSLGSARNSILNPGAHGLSEVLYAFTSAANNNGSAFGGLAANTTFYNTALGIAMLVGRFVSMILVLGLAGNLAAKKHVPESAGTLPTTGPLFGCLLIGVVVVIAGLTYFPALSLGPVVEGLLP
jgi:K+-transporting ATPase ATPase A chain